MDPKKRYEQLENALRLENPNLITFIWNNLPKELRSPENTFFQTFLANCAGADLPMTVLIFERAQIDKCIVYLREANTMVRPLVYMRERLAFKICYELIKRGADPFQKVFSYDPTRVYVKQDQKFLESIIPIPPHGNYAVVQILQHVLRHYNEYPEWKTPLESLLRSVFFHREMTELEYVNIYNLLKALKETLSTEKFLSLLNKYFEEIYQEFNKYNDSSNSYSERSISDQYLFIIQSLKKGIWEFSFGVSFVSLYTKPKFQKHYLQTAHYFIQKYLKNMYPKTEIKEEHIINAFNAYLDSFLSSLQKTKNQKVALPLYFQTAHSQKIVLGDVIVQYDLNFLKSMLSNIFPAIKNHFLKKIPEKQKTKPNFSHFEEHELSSKQSLFFNKTNSTRKSLVSILDNAIPIPALQKIIFGYLYPIADILSPYKINAPFNPLAKDLPDTQNFAIIFDESLFILDFFKWKAYESLPALDAILSENIEFEIDQTHKVYLGAHQ